LHIIKVIDLPNESGQHLFATELNALNNPRMCQMKCVPQ